MTIDTSIIPNNYHPLLEQLHLSDDLPYNKDWSAAADFLQLIVDHCLKNKPTTIVECSSGMTSIMLAKCCQINQQGKVYSLENGEPYAANTRHCIDQQALSRYADIIHAPLVDITVGNDVFQWYSLEKLAERPIDMLVIDGPPGFIQPLSRYPALPMLYERLTDQCVVFLDDAARDDEKEIVQRWQVEFPGTRHQYIDTERGCSVLWINK